MRSAEIPEVQVIINELSAEASTPVEVATVASWQAEFDLDRAEIAAKRLTGLGDLATSHAVLYESLDGTIVTSNVVERERAAGRVLDSGYLDGVR